MSRVTLVNLETLCTIARLGSFSAAADRLNATQPAISKRVKDLEQALGVPLFRRQGRRMELTIQGRELVQRAQPLLSGLEEVVALGSQPAAASGVIRMGVGEIVAVTWFGALMARLKQAMPGVSYEIQVGLTVDMRHKLEIGQLDLAILAGPLASSLLTAVPIGEIDLVWLAGAGIVDPRAGGRPQLQPLLKQQPFWCVARPSHMHPMAVHALKRLGLPRKSINTSDSVQCIVQMVAAGAGVALLPEPLVRGLLQRGEVVALAAPEGPERLAFVVARHRDHDHALVAHIMQWVQDSSAFLAR